MSDMNVFNFNSIHEMKCFSTEITRSSFGTNTDS